MALCRTRACWLAGPRIAFCAGRRDMRSMLDCGMRTAARPGIWNLLACSACGLVRLDPRPLPDEIGKLYHAYYTHAPSDPWSGVLFTWGNRRGARSVLAAAFGYAALATGKKGAAAGRILSRIGLPRDVIGATVMWLPASPRGRLLDVGCGGGVRESLERMGTPAPPVPVHK